MRRRQGDPQAVRFWSQCGLAVFCVLMLTVWEHVQATNVESQLRTLRREADRLTYENGRLDSQINQWESPSHLDVVGRKELGMIALDSAHIIGLNRQ